MFSEVFVSLQDNISVWPELLPSRSFPVVVYLPFDGIMELLTVPLNDPPCKVTK
jgi:hypothetical protein